MTRSIGWGVALVVLCAATAVAIDCTTDPSTGTSPCPIIINLANGSYELTGAEAPVQFDFYGTGRLVWMGWTAAATEQAFLCLDRNHNGTIDNGAELFGNVTPLYDGTLARNGFDALAEFDANRDMAIDAADSIWPNLLLWRDLNHDAVTQPEEISRVTDSAVVAIGLDYHFSGRVDPSGNALRYQSKVWIGERAPRPVYDVFFAPVS